MSKPAPIATLKARPAFFLSFFLELRLSTTLLTSSIQE